MQAEEIRQGVASELLTCPEGFAVVKSYLLIVAMLYAGAVSAEVPTGDDYLVPRFRAGQTFSNVFSILRSMKADGYDEHVSRNGGSADDTVLSIRPSAWRFSSTWRYDGQAGGHDEEELRDGGRTYCSVNVGAQDKCSPYLEASGLTYNPTLWGVPPKQVIQGMKWNVDLKQAWELGGKNGTQMVTVIRVDPLTDTVTLMREGTSEGGFSESDANTIQLSHADQTEKFDIVPGASHWKGYTTFVKGIVFSDELLVTRSDVLHAKNGKTVNAIERRIMLLNSSPFPTL